MGDVAGSDHCGDVRDGDQGQEAAEDGREERAPGAPPLRRHRVPPRALHLLPREPVGIRRMAHSGNAQQVTSQNILFFKFSQLGTT